MIQLQNIPNMILTLLRAPLGLMGVIVSLLIFDMPMGFLSQLGILVLSGIIIRNSVLLMERIDLQMAAGESRYHWRRTFGCHDSDPVCSALHGGGLVSGKRSIEKALEPV